MSFINTPLPSKPTLRHMLSRWGFDLGSREHVHILPLMDYIEKGLKLYFKYNGLALSEDPQQIKRIREEVNQSYFKLDNLPWGEVIKINEVFEITGMENNYSYNGEGISVDHFKREGLMISPITPVKLNLDPEGFQIKDFRSSYYSLDDCMKGSPYYFTYWDERVFLDIDNIKEFEQRYMRVDHGLDGEEAHLSISKKSDHVDTLSETTLENLFSSAPTKRQNDFYSIIASVFREFIGAKQRFPIRSEAWLYFTSNLPSDVDIKLNTNKSAVIFNDKEIDREAFMKRWDRYTK